MSRAAGLVFASICLIGCGHASMDESGRPSGKMSESSVAFDSAGNVETATRSANEPEASRQPVEAGERKIIYTATIELVVKDLQDTESKIKALVKKDGGYVAQFHQDRRYGDQLETSWTVRIPVANFEAFVDAVAELGVPESRRIESQEVTKQFRDLSARLDNKRRTEKEFQKLMEDRTKTIDDIASVAEKLSRVREEIELIEGELRQLQDLIALTTVTIVARENKDYTPPQAPTFLVTIKETFGDSLSSLQAFGKGCVLFVVAIAPWLPVVLIIALPLWHFLFRRRKRRPTRSAP